MANGNVVIVSGNLTKDPEARTFESGSNKARAGIAWNQNRSMPDGTWENVAHFFQIEAWKGAANTLMKFKKGDLLTVYGRLDWHSWEQDGQHREAVIILADGIIGEKMYEKAGPVASGGSSPDVDPTASPKSGQGSGRARPSAVPDPGPVTPAEQAESDDGIPW